MSKSCELHLVPNCPLCAKQTSVVVSSVPTTPIQTTQASVNPTPQTPPESKITDPTAQKMLAAAGKYAQECEAVKTISEAIKNLVEVHLKNMQEVIAASKNKLKEAETNRDAAQKEMMVLLGGKS